VRRISGYVVRPVGPANGSFMFDIYYPFEALKCSDLRILNAKTLTPY
jgi:hypothetical protein